MANRDDLIKLVQDLPDGELERAHGLLVSLLRAQGDDPWATLPLDDEPEVPGEAAAVQKSKDAQVRGEVTSLDDLERELGLS